MNFIERYNKLNAKQREAVDTIYGPVLVIAGPGSGKTELLAVRIANILRETDANPSNILCLTFTDNAARNMRERLTRIIGQDAYRVAIHTFHTFGLEILNRFRHRLQEEDDLSPIDEIEASRIFHDMIRDLPWDHPWKKKSRLGTLRNTIRLLKDAGISAQDFSQILDINGQILDDIRPKIAEYGDKLFSLGRKKEESIQKVSFFSALHQELQSILSAYPTHYQLHETISTVILRSLDTAISNITSETDTKPITAWKGTWLDKKGTTWVCKDDEKQKDARALLGLYSAYQEALTERSLIDFSDMILRAISLIESDDTVRAMLAEQYQWVMIDEYQDTNDAQLRLITSILRASIDSPNIFAVGDDDQSIYKFQGANTRNIRLFHELYSDTHLIILEENYRSQQEVIEFSRSIMMDSLHSLDTIFPGVNKVFRSIRGTGGTVGAHVFETELEELAWVADDVEQKIKDGVVPRDIAIITKKNSTLEYVAKLLLAKHIPIALSKEENILQNEIVTYVITVLQYISSLTEGNDRDELLIEIISHPMWGVHRLTLWELSRKIWNAKKEENKSWIESLRTHSDRDISKIAYFLIELSLRASQSRLEELIDLITGVNELNLSEEYLDDGAREQFTLNIDGESRRFVSPLYGYYFSEKTLRGNPTLYASHLSQVRTLIESVRSFRKHEGRLMLQDFSRYIELLYEYDISLAASSLIGSDDAVQCITAHKSKGLEYTHVYAIGLTEKQYKRGKNTSNPLPSNLSLAPEKDDDEDIRRLIYTVATRAKDSLTLTYARISLSEKPDSLVSVLGHTDIWTDIKLELDKNTQELLLVQEYQPLVSLPFTGEEESFLRELIDKNFSLSATALQNFLDITNGGPEKFLSNNILRFPQAKSSSAIYGTAMHKALEDFFRDYKHRGTYQKNILFESFAKKLKEDGLEKDQEREFLNRGRDTLEKLYTKITGQSYGELHLEYRFIDGGGTYLDDIRLTGAIDRIEITPDGKLIITDYKTGAGFNTLTGGSSHEAVKKWKYRLQLTFYALLFSLTPRWGAYQTREYRLFFIEEDRETGEFSEVIEYIHDGEIERLKKLIQAVMGKVRNLDFPDISTYPPTVDGIRQFEDDLIQSLL